MNFKKITIEYGNATTILRSEDGGLNCNYRPLNIKYDRPLQEDIYYGNLALLYPSVYPNSA